jgi:vitamin B12 transporter
MSVGLLASLVLIVRLVDPAGAPIPNASVTASTRDTRVRVEVRTDTTGTARLPVAPAEYILQIWADGFAVVVQPVLFSATHDSLQLTLPLAGVADRVVVTASGNLQTADEVAKAVSVIDAEAIENRGAFSIAGAIGVLPGVNVQQLGGPGSFTSIKVRGLREQDTAVLIDGARFRDAGAPQGDATGFVGELYLTNLDRVEVLRGSGSSLHGSHAVGGAINLITRAGSSQPATDLRLEAGALGYYRAGAHVGAGSRSGRVTFSVGVGHTLTNKGVDGDDRAVNTSVHGRGDARLRPAATVSVRTYWSEAGSKINESPGAIGPLPHAGHAEAVPFVTFTPSLNDPDNTRDSRFISTLVRFDHRASGRIGYSGSFHHLKTTRAYADGPLGVSAFEPPAATHSDFDGTLDTADLRADLDWNDAHTTTAGYEIELEQAFSRSVPVNRAATWSAEIAQTGHSVWIQQQLRRSMFTLAASARWQTFALDHPIFAPSDRAPFTAEVFATPPAAVTADVSAARWFAGTQTKVRAHVGNAYRAPSMYERAGSSFSSRGYTVYGDPRLGSERSVSFDAGVDQTLAGGRLRASATWYRARLQRVIAFGSLAADPFGRTSGYLLADGRVAQGVEVSAHAEPARRTRLDAAYTFANADAPADNRDGLPRASAVPAHQFSISVDQRIGPALRLSLQVVSNGDHYLTLFDPVSFGSRAFRFDGATTADVAAHYRVRVGRALVTLSAIAGNLFDRDYFLQGFTTPGRTGRVRVAVGF